MSGMDAFHCFSSPVAIWRKCEEKWNLRGEGAINLDISFGLVVLALRKDGNLQSRKVRMGK